MHHPSAIALAISALLGAGADPAAHPAVGTTGLELGFGVDAVRALERATERNPCDAGILRALVEARLRNAYDTAGGPDQAELEGIALLATDLVSLDPRCEHQILKLRLELAAKHRTDAKSTAQAAIVANPGCWEAHLTMASILAHDGHYPDALRALEIALSLAPTEAKPRVWRMIGYVHERRHAFLDAEVAYQNAGDKEALGRVAANKARVVERIHYHHMDHFPPARPPRQ